MALYCETFSVAFLVAFDIVWGDPQLHVSNNGPAVLDGNITFLSLLEDFGPSTEELLYIFNDGIQNISVISNSTNVSTSFMFEYPDYKEGCYNMSVSVVSYESPANVTSKELSFLKSDIIASAYSIFKLSSSLIGKIIVNRPVKADVSEVAVGENITVAVQLYDPDSYLSSAILDYMWSIDYDTPSHFVNNFTYMYAGTETSHLVANVIAVFSNNMWKSGIFSKKLTVKDPVSNVNISGNPFIRHGEMLLLNVTCNGSAPFIYCARPLSANESSQNFTCQQSIISTTCSFPIQHYFRNYGTYEVGVYISNDVKVVKRILKVVVYNVSKKPQLSTVITPVVCSLMTLIIIAGGIAYYVQQRNQIAIEVADFDFQDDPEPDISKTFFEKIFDSLMCPCRGSVVSDDVLYEEDKPLLGWRSSRRLSI